VTDSQAFLVPINGTYALVDASSERLFVLNAAGAEAWQELASGRSVGADDADFVSELVELGLLAQAPCEWNTAQVRPATDEPARIIARAPLQVAANTSDPSPFSEDPIW
jgi:hypothetical protein